MLLLLLLLLLLMIECSNVLRVVATAIAGGECGGNGRCRHCGCGGSGGHCGHWLSGCCHLLNEC